MSMLRRGTGRSGALLEPRTARGVVSDFLQEAVELFPTPEEAEAVVRAWDGDEPDRQVPSTLSRSNLRLGRRTRLRW
jgi:hypothetical protein